jgi:sugar phosphate isomerase/epimerase
VTKGEVLEVPLFSAAGATTLKLSFEEDLAVLQQAGVEGIGLDEAKLRDDRVDLDRFRASGLRASLCFPSTPSILPLPHWPGLDDPGARIDDMCRGVRRLAPFEPATCVCSTGPPGNYEQEEAMEVVVTGIRQVARAAADVGVMIAVEPMHISIAGDWSLIATVPETVELLARVDEPNTGILFDVWHLWDSPDVLRHLRLHARRILGVHVDDWRDPTRGWCDRVLPGDGVADLPGILGALDEGGFDGWFDLEIFSDDGTFGESYPDSLWKLDPVELIRAGREQFMRAWRERRIAGSDDLASPSRYRRSQPGS